MSYLSNPGDNLTEAQQAAILSFIALSTTPTGYHLAKDASGNFVNTADTGGGAMAGGTDGQVQYNNASGLGGITGATYNGTKLNLLSSTVEFSDGTDPTKKTVLALNTISTGTTVTLTVPNQSGTIALVSDIPKINQVLDTNGNKILTFTTTAGAVNYIDIKDAATGTNPTFTASGTDANIGFNFVTKGAGTFTINGSTVALDSNVVHLTGNEGIAGLKVFSNKLEALDIIKITGGSTSTENLTSGGGAGRFGLAAGYSGGIGGRLMFGDGTGWQFKISTGLPNAPTDLLSIRDTGEVYGNLLLPQGYMTNGKIVTSVASGALTVAIKTLAGNNPSANDPVYVRIGNTVRTITSALSISSTTGTNWLNLGSYELLNQEVDLFVYLRWNTVDNAVNVLFSRIPYAIKSGDFVVSSTDEKGLVSSGTFTGTDEVEVVGRFNAILSNTAQWSIPATPVIINRPIYETRQLSFTSQAFASGGGFSIGNGSIESSYLIAGKMVHLSTRFNCGSTTNLGSGQISFTFPIQNDIGGFGIQLRTLGGGSGAAYNGSTYPVTPVTNFYNSNGGMMFATPNTSNAGVLGANNPFAWGAGCYAGAGFSYNLI